MSYSPELKDSRKLTSSKSFQIKQNSNQFIDDMDYLKILFQFLKSDGY